MIPICVWKGRLLGVAAALTVLVVAGGRAAPLGASEPSQAASNGPFQYHAQATFGSLFSTAEFGHAQPREGTDLQLVLNWGNVWAEYEDEIQRQFLLDWEYADLRVELEFQLSRAWRVSTSYDERRRFGGLLDSVIDEFHQATGLDRDGRERVANGSLQFRLEPENLDHYILDPPSRRHHSNARVAFRYTPDKPWAALGPTTWSTAVLINGRVRSPGVSGDAFDLGVALDTTTRLTRRGKGGTHLHTLWSLTYTGADHFGPYAVRPIQGAFGFAFEWQGRRTGRRSTLLQVLAGGPSLKNLRRFNAVSWEVIAGVRYRLDAKSHLEVGIAQNLLNFPASPDLGFHFAFRRRLR